MRIFGKNKERNKVGRPKLADAKLKKTSLIIIGVMVLVIIGLLAGGLTSLNILPKYNKLKGEANRKYEVGEKFCLDTECFYTISDNGTTVTALAQHNLLVGYKLKTDFRDFELTEIENTIDGYGLQNSLVTGLSLPNVEELEEMEEMEIPEWIGVVPFANIDENNWAMDGPDKRYCGYWTEECSMKLTSPYLNEENLEIWDLQKGLLAFKVYNEGSLLYKYVENYASYLGNLTNSSVSARLLTYSEAINLGCSGENKTCNDAYAWVNSNSYFTGSGGSKGYNIWFITADETIFESTFLETDFSNPFGGVRPVITINKEDIEKIRVKGINFKEKSIELGKGQTNKLVVNVLPEDAINKNVIWKSSNESVVVVDENGNVTAINEGTAIVTAQTEEGNYTDNCEVTVINLNTTISTVATTNKTIDKTSTIVSKEVNETTKKQTNKKTTYTKAIVTQDVTKNTSNKEQEKTTIITSNIVNSFKTTTIKKENQKNNIKPLFYVALTVIILGTVGFIVYKRREK